MRKKRHLGTLLIVITMVLTIGMTAFAETSAVEYTVDTQYQLKKIYIPTKDNLKLSIDTRPSTGVAGVDVLVQPYGETSIVQSFPYQVDRAPWVMSIVKGKVYQIAIRSRQDIASGVLYCSVY